jgi:hypothetical protein
MVSVDREIIYLKMYRLFVTDIFTVKRTNGIEEISRYSDFDR